MTGPLLIDRRSRLHRRVLELWAAWDITPPAWLRALAPLTARINARLIDQRLRRRAQPPAHPFIVSIGNLVSGGGGKTPLVIDLATSLAARGLRGAILTRGYGSRLAGPLTVDPRDPACGDEARLLAERCPRWTVVQARERIAGLSFLGATVPDAEIIIIEDGYQTAGVPRHLDILILDRWRETTGVPEARTGHLLPWGPYRESAAAAARADVWILNRLEPGADSRQPAAGLPVLRMERRATLPLDGTPDKTSGYGLLSGIADPAGFEAACRELCGHPPRIIGRFDDHARYTTDALVDLWKNGRRLGVRRWLTTAKDRVKLQAIWPADLELVEIGLDLVWGAGRSLADLVIERMRSQQDV